MISLLCSIYFVCKNKLLFTTCPSFLQTSILWFLWLLQNFKINAKVFLKHGFSKIHLNLKFYQYFRKQTGQKLCRCNYQSFLLLSNFAWFFYFVPYILSVRTHFCLKLVPVSFKPQFFGFYGNFKSFLKSSM